MKLNNHFCLIFFLCCFFSIAEGQNQNTNRVKRCSIKTLNYETGLLNNATTDVITDALGFTWISTKIGLQRFNGSQLETITPVISKDTIAINQPVYLFNPGNGKMWISYQNSVIEYDPFQNTFRFVITTKPSGNAGFSIVPLKKTADGIWCMQQKKGIVIYNADGKIIRTFSFSTAAIDDIIHSEQLLYKTIIASNSNDVFISGVNNQILKINTASKTFGFVNCKDSIGLCIASTENKLFMLGSGRLSIMNIKTGIIERTFSFKKINSEITNNHAINIDSFNQLFVSMNNHLYEFDTSGKFKTEITDLNRSPVVDAGSINKIYSDKFRRIWLLNNDNISRIQNVETPFLHFIYPAAKNNFVKSVYYDEQKRLLLAGCFGGGLQLYDTLSRPLWKDPLLLQGVKDIIAIEKLADDKYLIVSYGRGWFLLALSEKKLLPFPFSKTQEAIIHPTLERFTNNLQRINDSTILISTGQNVFKCVFRKTHLQSVVRLLTGKSFQNDLNCFLYAKNKMLWIGTATGVVFKTDTEQQTQAYPIPGNYIVRAISEDSTHHIWVGTDKGLYIYSSAGTLVKKVSEETGLLNDCIYSLLPLKKSSAVFSATNLGLSFISLAGIVKNYSKELGLQDMEFNTAACAKTLSGKFYFGGTDGVTAFYPDALSSIKDTPGIFITRLIVNDISQNFFSGIGKKDSIVLNYFQNHLQLDIAAIGLLNPDEYIYRYRLKGFQNRWQITDHPSNINYILSPGKYILQIVCAPNLSTNVFFKKDIYIVIHGPWWQTLWFKILAILCFMTFIVSIVHRYNRNKFKQKVRLLQAKYQMQQERERISRDLHDNLGAQANALLYGTEQLQNSNTKETGLIDNLHATAKDMMLSLRETIWVMKHNDATASEIWFRILNFCKQLALFHEEIKFKTEGELPETFVFNSEQALHIILIVQEALNNAVRHAAANNILIQSNSDKNSWIIEIKDDGKGIDESGSSEAIGGFGLVNMEERAHFAEININIESEKGKGTCVMLIIPLEKISNPK